MFTLLIVVIVIALLFDLVNGFHDAANSIATVVSTKVLTPLQAVIWAAGFNVLAFWVFDMSVGNTVAKTVNNNAIDLWVILSGLLAATFWNLLTWRLGIPSSSSHTLIGGFAGAAVAHAGFGVIDSSGILIIIAFIFLAPIIGGILAFGIALITMSRRFLLKFIVVILCSLGIYFLMDYMVEYMDMKKEMMWIVVAMLVIFILAYIYYMMVHGKRQTALKESNMYKRLQLLSSAAFSLGHGGADSQKVMGIICAALLVYGNLERQGKVTESIPSQFRISEMLQISYENQDGKHHKFKPMFGEFNGVLFYMNDDKIKDIENQEVIAKNNKLNKKYSKSQKINSIKDEHELNEKLKKLTVYSMGHGVYDAESNELIFHKNKLNENYSKAGLFTDFVSNGVLKHGSKIVTKVNSETMPFWISFGCYLMIAIGTLFGGWKIVKTMGSKITKVSPLEGVCAETAGALTLFVVSNLGIPVSTTHTITGSIIGVGATKRLSAVRWGVTINLLWAWVLTIPVSALLAAGFYYLICLFK
jgi:inorganic phosphate transporter, PiT family